MTGAFRASTLEGIVIPTFKKNTHLKNHIFSIIKNNGEPEKRYIERDI